MITLSRARAWTIVTAAFGVELYKATAATMRAAVAPRGRLKPAILAIPLDVRSPAGITLFADMVTLTPGTTSLAVAADRRTLYVHCLDVADADATVADLKSGLEAQVKEVLP